MKALRSIGTLIDVVMMPVLIFLAAWVMLDRLPDLITSLNSEPRWSRLPLQLLLAFAPVYLLVRGMIWWIGKLVGDFEGDTAVSNRWHRFLVWYMRPGPVALWPGHAEYKQAWQAATLDQRLRVALSIGRVHFWLVTVGAIGVVTVGLMTDLGLIPVFVWGTSMAVITIGMNRRWLLPWSRTVLNAAT